jgi:hypothetical protein
VVGDFGGSVADIHVAAQSTDVGLRSPVQRSGGVKEVIGRTVIGYELLADADYLHASSKHGTRFSEFPAYP